MPWFLSLFAAVLVITAIVQPRLGAGWQWDLGNATGYCVIAGLLYLTLPIAQGRGNVRRHELFGNLVLLLALAHALWFLLIDGAAFTYLLPAAPAFMWAGTGALVALMALMSVAAMPARKRVHPVFARFRVWHRWLAVLALAGVLWHAVGSGFYVQTWY